MGDTRYVLWAEGGNGGTVGQVTVLGDWDEELRPKEWWVVSQWSEGGQGKKGKNGKKGKTRKRGGGTFRVPGDLLFLTREDAEVDLREALEESDGDNGDDEGGGGDNKGGDKRGEEGGGPGGDKGGEKEGDTGVRKGVPGARMRPGSPPPRRRGSLRVATRKRGAGGWGG